MLEKEVQPRLFNVLPSIVVRTSQYILDCCSLRFLCCFIRTVIVCPNNSHLWLASWIAAVARFRRLLELVWTNLAGLRTES
jgi:hypothetical protein